MASHHHAAADHGAGDSSASSTPRAAHHPHLPPPTSRRGVSDEHGGGGQVRLMCSFGGRILPRPGDHQLRYVGGETRIVAVPRAATFAGLVAVLAKLAPALFGGGRQPPPLLKYQLPNEDLDALISLTSDDDLDNMMDELDRLHSQALTAAKSPRLRLFLFPPTTSSAAAFGSVLSGAGDTPSDQWFVDALNSPAPQPASVERGKSEASSIVSEVPDYLFGLDTTSDEPSPTPAQPKSEPEMMETHNDDETTGSHARAPPPQPFVPESVAWPPYMTQPVYYVPVRPVQMPPPFHYLDPAQGGFYLGGHHIVGGGGELYATTAGGGVYGAHPFPAAAMYPPPPGAAVYPEEAAKPDGGAHSS